jgi:hypothetical protein
MRKGYAWLLKGDSPTFHGADDEDEMVEELKKLRRREAAIVERIRLGRLEAVDAEDEEDDVTKIGDIRTRDITLGIGKKVKGGDWWSSQFEEEA